MLARAARGFEIAMAEDLGRLDPIEIAKTGQQILQAANLGRARFGAVKVADESDSDVASIERWIAGMGALIFHWASFPDSTVLADQEVVSKVTPVEIVLAVALKDFQVFPGITLADGRKVFLVLSLIHI